MSANHSDLLIYGRTMADARVLRQKFVEEQLQPVCANGCGRGVDCLGEVCSECWNLTQQED